MKQTTSVYNDLQTVFQPPESNYIARPARVMDYIERTETVTDEAN